MRERIISLRKALGLTQEKFGEKIGIRRGTVANYEVGRNMPSNTVRQMICRVYGVRAEWLENDEGEMFEEKSRYEQVGEIAGRYMDWENSPFRKRLITVIAELPEDKLAVLAEIAEKIAGQ